MEEEKELKTYIITETIVRKSRTLGYSHDEAEVNYKQFGFMNVISEEVKTFSINEFNPLKSNEEVEKDEQRS